MMYVTLATQTAAVMALLMLLPTPVAPLEERRIPVVLGTPTEPAKLRCRLYFGCTPHAKAADAMPR